MNLYARLAKTEGLSPAEREVAIYIVKNSSSIASISIQDLAHMTFTSTATVMRLCKKLGFEGFADFKVAYANDYRSMLMQPGAVDINFPFSGDEPVDVIGRRIADLTKLTVSSCQAQLDYGVIGKVSELLLAARRVFAVGVSDTFLRVADFQNKMMKIGALVEISFLQPDQAYLCNLAGPEDLALLVSYSGRTLEVINEARILEKRSVPTCGITAYRDSPVAQLCDTVILMPPEEDVWTANYTFASQIAIEYVLNVLFSCVYAARYRDNLEHLRSSRGSYLHP